MSGKVSTHITFSTSSIPIAAPSQNIVKMPIRPITRQALNILDSAQRQSLMNEISAHRCGSQSSTYHRGDISKGRKE